MLQPRLIPCLLLKDDGLVKTIHFKKPVYVGDPINTVKIFNNKDVDEVVIFDISATSKGRSPNFELIREISSECFIPLMYGGGVRSISDMDKLYNAGIEKVSINTEAVMNPSLIQDAANRFGNQSVVVSIDVKTNIWGKDEVMIRGGAKRTKLSPVEYAREAERCGCGEIVLNSINREGTGTGYDIELIKAVSQSVNIPVVAVGGAGKLEDFKAAVKDGGASAAAAGSFFVFQGKHRAVLISYPSRDELSDLFS